MAPINLTIFSVLPSFEPLEIAINLPSVSWILVCLPLHTSVIKFITEFKAYAPF